MIKKLVVYLLFDIVYFVSAIVMLGCTIFFYKTGAMKSGLIMTVGLCIDIYGLIIVVLRTIQIAKSMDMFIAMMIAEEDEEYDNDENPDPFE